MPVEQRWSISFKSFQSLMGVVIFATLCGCQQMAVHWAFGRGWNLESGPGRSFDWVPAAQKTTGEFWARNPSADALIRGTVERELTSKGYKQDTAGHADFWIDYHVITERKPEWLDFGPVVEYAQGSLYLDVIDASNRQVVWRASAESKLELNASPDEVKSRIQAAVPLMLKHLPDWKPPRG